MAKSSTLGNVIKRGYEEILERKITNDESETLMFKVSRDNFKRREECKEKGIECKRTPQTKEYLESLLKEDC